MLATKVEGVINKLNDFSATEYAEHINNATKKEEAIAHIAYAKVEAFEDACVRLRNLMKTMPSVLTPIKLRSIAVYLDDRADDKITERNMNYVLGDVVLSAIDNASAEAYETAAHEAWMLYRATLCGRIGEKLSRH